MYESLVAEYIGFSIPPFVPRRNMDFDLPKPKQHNLIYSIVGVRRCGKTFFLYQLMDRLMREGVPRDRIFHFTLDDERVMPFSERTLSDLLDAYYKLVPEAVEGCYLFLDEIQEAPCWTNFVRRISEQRKVTIVLTGSSSKLLSKDIPTHLRGRSLSKEIWPLGFDEYCDFRGVVHEGVESLTAEAAGRLEVAFFEYLQVGGFPAVQNMLPLDRVQLLQGYAAEIVTKDVLERFETTSIRVAERFARNALRSTGLKFSVNNQLKDIRAAGMSASNEKLYALLDDLEDAHLVFRVNDYTLSIRENPRSSSKVYSVDPGLALAVAPASHLDVGQRLETAVFVELKRRFGADRTNVIATYSAVDCPEVDFIVGDVALGDQHQLLQVAVRTGAEAGLGLSPDRLPKKYKSEIGNLETAMKRSGLDTGAVITLSEEAEFPVSSGTVRLVPAWKWFLGR